MSASKKLFSLFVYLVMSLFHFHFGRIALLIQNCWLNSSFSFCLQVSITSNETLANSIFFSYLFIYLNLGVFLFFLIFIFTLFYFTILNWFCHTLTWIHFEMQLPQNTQGGLLIVMGSSSSPQSWHSKSSEKLIRAHITGRRLYISGY